MLGITIDPTLIDPEEKEMLEDLIIAAINDAKKKVDDCANDAMSSAAGGLPAGMKLPF